MMQLSLQNSVGKVDVWGGYMEPPTLGTNGSERTLVTYGGTAPLTKNEHILCSISK